MTEKFVTSNSVLLGCISIVVVRICQLSFFLFFSPTNIAQMRKVSDIHVANVLNQSCGCDFQDMDICLDIIIIDLKGAIQDFVPSPQCAANCLQHAC